MGERRGGEGGIRRPGTVASVVGALFACLLLVGRPAVAQTWDALLHRATREAATEQGRLAKEAFLGGGADSLRFVMDNAHYRNVGIHILLDEMVRTYDDPSGAEVLATFLSSSHARTRKVAAYYMGYFDTPDLAGRVRPLLEDDYVRAMAVRTLGKWKSTNDVTRIITCLDDPQERVRVAAANALRDIGDDRAAMGLIMALDDPVFTVRNCAERALRGLGGETDELIYAAADNSLPAQLALEARGFAECAASDDWVEGVNAFVEKRKPLFRGS